MNGLPAVGSLILLGLSVSCSLSRAKVAPYPSGAIFPVEEVERLTYEGKIVNPIIKTDGNLYFSTDRGFVYCLESSARQVLWKYAVTSPIISAPVVGEENLFFLDEQGIITSVNKNGKFRWKTAIKDNRPTSLSQDGRGVYIGTQEGYIVALAPSSGEQLWQLALGGSVRAPAVFWKDSIIVSGADGRLHFLGHQGKSQATFDLGGAVAVTPLVDGDRLYVGTEDAMFHCLDLNRVRRAWRIKLGGRLLAQPRSDEKKIFLVVSNSVLYALNKKGGDILWWRAMPSRGPYRPELSDGKILASSSSPELICLNRETGKEEGKYDAGLELRADPLWVEPYLLVNAYDFREKNGILMFLAKQVRVKLSASASSPQPEGTEVTFNVSTVGFYLPRFEFSMDKGEGRAVVQAASERDSWVWYADKEGKYKVGVRVTDAKQEKEAEIHFEIVKKAKQAGGQDLTKGGSK